MTEPIGMLLAKARAQREGLDTWRTETPSVLRALREAGVPFSRIEEETGIPEGTAARLAGRASPTPDNSTSSPGRP